MNTPRPNFERLYVTAYRRFHELLGRLEDVINLQGVSQAHAMTLGDVYEKLREIHGEFATQDWSH